MSALPIRPLPHCTAFADTRRITAGTLPAIATTLKALVDQTPQAQILIFDDHSGNQVDLNLHGTLDDVLARMPRPHPSAPATDGAVGAAPARGAGRPKLGVTGREVTLLPRHWDWLSTQPGGASVALRKLVEHALRDNQPLDRQRRAREVAYKVMSALAGDNEGFEEASRALFAGDAVRYARCIAGWPADVRDYISLLAQDGLTG
jgi:hypothetical protein